MSALLLAGLLAAADPAAGALPTVDPFSDVVFERMQAPRDTCLRGVLRRFAEGVDADCAFPGLKSKHFVRQWERAFPGDVYPEGVLPLTGWTRTLGGWLGRYFEIDGVPALVAYGGRQPGLVLGYFNRPAGCPGEDVPQWRPGLDGVSRPERVPGAWTQAVYPVAARRRGINGMVLVRAVIDREGRTRSLCVLDVQPPGYGFAEAAVETLRQHRYEPAVREGRPVAVQLPLAQTFEIDGAYRY